MFSQVGSVAGSYRPAAPINSCLQSIRDDHSVKSSQRSASGNDEFLNAVLAGFRSNNKEIPIKYIYDAQGSELFEAECESNEYYIRRAETEAVATYSKEIAKHFPPGTTVVEFGSGSSRKVQHLMAATSNIATYVPIDIDPIAARSGASEISKNFPSVRVMPLCADFTKLSALPSVLKDVPVTGLFLGATIGNSLPHEAISLLASYRFFLGQNSTLFIGADLAKDPAVLIKAYSGATTASLNLYLLTRMNRELGSNIDIEQFEYSPVWDARLSAVEHRIVSKVDQTFQVAGETFEIKQGEHVRVSQSVKYSVEEFTRVANAAGWNVVEQWTTAPQVAIFALQPAPAIDAAAIDLRA